MIHSVIIAVIVGVVALGISVGVFLPETFTSSLDKIKSEIPIEQVSNSIKNIQPPTLSFYEVNSRCDFSYFLLDLHHTKKMHLKNTVEIDEDKIYELVEEVRNQIIEEYGGMDEVMIKIHSRQIDSSEIGKEMMNEIATKGEKYTLTPYMEAHSIHPKFRDDVAQLLKTSGEVYQKKLPIKSPVFYAFVKLTESQFNADPECAQKHNEHFSSTMAMLKDNWDY